LHGIHDILLLREEGVAELLRPVELLVHHRQHVGKRDQRFHARVPGFFLDGLRDRIAFDVGMLLLPARRLHDFQRIGRGHEDLREQRIRIQRDRRDDLFQLFGLERWRLCWCLRLSVRLRSRCLFCGHGGTDYSHSRQNRPENARCAFHSCALGNFSAIAA